MARASLASPKCSATDTGSRATSSGRRACASSGSEVFDVTGDVRREWFEKDYYQVLGVAKNATQAEIKKVYRKLAQQHHPDANQGSKDSEERFKEISAAYDVIGDPEKRKQYDEVRDMAASGVGSGGFPGGFGNAGGPGGVRFEDVGFTDIGDLFGGLFGGGGRRG